MVLIIHQIGHFVDCFFGFFDGFEGLKFFFELLGSNPKFKIWLRKNTKIIQFFRKLVLGDLLDFGCRLSNLHPKFKNSKWRIQNGGRNFFKKKFDVFENWIQNLTIQNGGSNMADQKYKNKSMFFENWYMPVFLDYSRRIQSLN